MQSFLSFKIGVALKFSLHVFIEIIDDSGLSVLPFLDLVGVDDVPVPLCFLLDGLDDRQIDQVVHFFLQLVLGVIVGRPRMLVSFCRLGEEARLHFMIMKLPEVMDKSTHRNAS